MYTFFKRTLPYPTLMVFDCPDANATSVRRASSNTPLQALATLNNEVFFEAAQALGRRIVEADLAGDAVRIEYAWRMCLARPPSPFERERVLRLLSEHREWYEEHHEDAVDLVGATLPDGATLSETAAWIATANVVMNLDEFITRE
jgi:hypothetical protein